MSRVMTFMRTFPAYHPRKGQETYFVEKICKDGSAIPVNLSFLTTEGMQVFYDPSVPPKRHTIRSGHRWKPGDKFSPRVWSEKPYRSKQIIFAEDIMVLKVWDFRIRTTEGGTAWLINDRIDFYKKGDFEVGNVVLGLPGTVPEHLCMNDGLSWEDMQAWFNVKEFDGQIICWNENVKY